VQSTHCRPCRYTQQSTNLHIWGEGERTREIHKRDSHSKKKHLARFHQPRKRQGLCVHTMTTAAQNALVNGALPPTQCHSGQVSCTNDFYPPAPLSHSHTHDVPSIHDSVLLPFDKVAGIFRTGQHQVLDLFHHAVPLCQTTPTHTTQMLLANPTYTRQHLTTSESAWLHQQHGPQHRPMQTAGGDMYRLISRSDRIW
jgi:hypothetical protein